MYWMLYRLSFQQQPFELIERIEPLERFLITAKNKMKMMKKVRSQFRSQSHFHADFLERETK
jgi:hypothetical protein